MGFRFEFDPVHKILLGRFEGRLTDESLAEFYRAGLKHWAATDASAAISDYSSVRSGPCPPNVCANLQMRNQP